MKTILIVEDHPQILRGISTILEMEGFKVLTACNGIDGVSQAKSLNPDLIICDVMMPGIDGFEVLRQIRALPDLKLTPFLFLTARAERSDMRTGMNLGADDYLTKPVVRTDLLDAVRTRLERRELQQRQSGGAGGLRADFSDARPLVEKLGLTPREAEVLLWVAQGKGNGDIATILGMAEKTVKKHLTSVFEKLGVEGRNAATLTALDILSGGGN